MAYKSNLGPAQAVLATTYKIAQVVYRKLKFNVDYQVVNDHEYNQRFRGER